ncbi:oligopeptide transport system permease protein oppB [Vibrio sp. JCM 19236]|nr:oligopeptide transport system permease protein oppB [Vibrio sp. JCM 19236]
MTAPLIEIKNLSVAFGGKKNPRRVTHDVSLSVHKGETLALVGESGSGKSVTANSILRLLPKASAVYETGLFILMAMNF